MGAGEGGRAVTLASPRRIVGGIAILFVLLAGGLCAAVIGVGLMLSSPAPAAIGQAPFDLNGAESAEIASSSGSRLHGWWVPAGVGGGVIVLMHGVRGNRLSMVTRAHVLHARGFSVLLFDLQAHGESPGRRITFGKLEGLDAAAAVQFVRDRRPGERVGVIGVSLGGAAALLGPDRLAADALILESVYPTIAAALANRLRVNLGPVAGPVFTPLLTPVFELLLPSILGASPGELRPIDRIAEVKCPILIASGAADTYTPLDEAKALFERATGPKQFWAVAGAGHVDLERYDPARYWDVVLPFMSSALKRERDATAPAAPLAAP